jgi:hypothetical protein
MVRLILLLLAAIGASADTIKVQIRRELPEEVRKTVTVPLSEEREVPLATEGCEGKAKLRALRFVSSIKAEGQTILVGAEAEADIEKLAKGPLAPPALIITGNQALTLVFERSMASAGWEGGGVFTESAQHADMQEPQFWKSVTLRCLDQSPYSAAVIPEGVTYKRADVKAIDDAVTRVNAALRSFSGFATPSLYDDVMMIGPDLFTGVRNDPALQKVSSPKVVMMDPNTGQRREMLRIKGPNELLQFGAAMRRYLGDAKPRIRAATSAELARYWMNIGWDIEEPLLIADYGAHRIVLDFTGGRVMMVDEIPRD